MVRNRTVPVPESALSGLLPVLYQVPEALQKQRHLLLGDGMERAAIDDVGDATVDQLSLAGGRAALLHHHRRLGH
eukprot:scaffold101544_cov60-Phaeocystis_antarctica.AAC.4